MQARQSTICFKHPKCPPSRSLRELMAQRSRSQSQSPVRQVPRIQHTNGRLNVEIAPALTARATSAPCSPLMNTTAPDAIQTIQLQRSSSCGDASASRRRFRLKYHDETIRLQSLRRTHELLVSAQQADAATSACSGSVAAKLAKKALKYRKLYDRVQDIDVSDPTFDVAAFLGVQWCKTS